MHGCVTATIGVLYNQLVVHFQPGARGDFLAAVIMEEFQDRGNSAVKHPSNYRKVHYDFNIDLYRNHLRIRIDDNGLIDNLMQIVFNSMYKNPLESYHDTDPMDHFYVRVIDCLSKDSADPAHYHYWVDFQYVNDLNWLRSYFIHFHGRHPKTEFWNAVQQNVERQLHWRSNPDLEKLSKLIDYERRFNLFDWNKTFNVAEFLQHSDPQTLLHPSNYSRTPFKL